MNDNVKEFGKFGLLLTAIFGIGSGLTTGLGNANDGIVTQHLLLRSLGAQNNVSHAYMKTLSHEIVNGASDWNWCFLAACDNNYQLGKSFPDSDQNFLDHFGVTIKLIDPDAAPSFELNQNSDSMLYLPYAEDPDDIANIGGDLLMEAYERAKLEMRQVGEVDSAYGVYKLNDGGQAVRYTPTMPIDQPTIAP